MGESSGMSEECGCPCPTPAVVLVPGTEGEAGSPGAAAAAGVDAFTYTDGTAGPFDKGDAGITITVLNSTAFPIGSVAAIEDVVGGTAPGYFLVTAKATNQLTLTFLDIAANADASSIATDKIVAIAGPQFDVGTLPVAITDNSTGTASDTIAAGAGVFTVAVPIQLAAMTTLAADLVTNYTPGFAFKILGIAFATTTISTGAGASQTLNLEIGSTNLTGGVLTLTLAGTDTLGELTSATAITAANTGSAADTISVEVAAGGTIFTAGAGVLLIKIQNMDTANAIAALADHVNDLISAL